MLPDALMEARFCTHCLDNETVSKRLTNNSVLALHIVRKQRYDDTKRSSATFILPIVIITSPMVANEPSWAPNFTNCSLTSWCCFALWWNIQLLEKFLRPSYGVSVALLLVLLPVLMVALACFLFFLCYFFFVWSISVTQTKPQLPMSLQQLE